MSDEQTGPSADGMDHSDWEPCEECGRPIDFSGVSSFFKTTDDEEFYHVNCYPGDDVSGTEPDRSGEGSQ